ncbi:site-specific integrase [Pectobacterium aroidearum]|uniref:site-specific integrase n=1 Tax=Pectobacterium aroidearum TaxID=1201031 RepID=UPI00301B0D81
MEPFKFTKAKLSSLPAAPKGKQVEYHDSHVKGLRLRVGATGVKTFCIVKKVQGKFFRTVIGRFPELSIEQARTFALEKLGSIGITGRNPNVEKRESDIANVSLNDALELYIKTRGHRLKATTGNQYRRMLVNFSGDWMNRPMANISRDDVFNRHKDITDGTAWFGSDITRLRSGVGSGSRAQADLWARALRAVYNFAHDNYRDEAGKKLLPEPPTVVLSTKRQWHGLVRKNTRIRNHELGRWIQAVDSVRNESLVNREDHIVAICDALDMALFTGLRRGEVFGLEWDRVNVEAGYFWIDKTKNGDPLELPLTNTLKNILQRRVELKDKNSRYVFPAAKGGIVSDPRRAIDMIVEKTSEDGKTINFTCHDARRTYATIAELSGVGTYILKRLMNHKTGQSADVTQGYISLPVEELLEPATIIERKILLEADGRSSDKSIVSILDTLSENDKKILLAELLKGIGDNHGL